MRRVWRAQQPRRGVSLVIVLIAISMSLALTYASLSSQSRGLQIQQNVDRKELARRAAESGAAIALAKIQSSSWSGVAAPLAGNLGSDATGTSSYSVTFLTIDGLASPAAYPTTSGLTSLGPSGGTITNIESPGLTLTNAATAATAIRKSFQLLIRSTGKWQSASSAADFVTVTVEAGTELQPRVIGRTILPGDTVAASDVFASNGQYDNIQQYALFATMGSSGNQSLRIEPGQRIDGASWINRGIRVFSGPGWSMTVRQHFLQDIGTQHTTADGTQTLLPYPHPFGGPVTHFNSLSTTESTNLTKLNVPHQQAAQMPTVPAVTFSAWKHYQLFQGGFTYDAEILSSGTLEDDVLRPTSRNPLGVFYREGNLSIKDDVVVQGTLVCTGSVYFQSNDVLLSSVNWRDESGGELVSGSSLFPRAPSLVATNVDFDKNIRVGIDGAVVVTNTMTGADGDFELLNVPALDVSGSQATARPIRQPFSEVQLPTTFDASSITNGGQYAVWLQDGISGQWLPIVSVDVGGHKLTVLGEVRHDQPVNFRIRPQRQRWSDIRGPLLVGRLQLSVPNAWNLGSFWSSRYSLWQLANDLLQDAGLSPVTWKDYVASPANYPSWGSPYETVGLPLDPIFHLKPLPGVKYRDALPLFKSYVAPPATGIVSPTVATDPSGYRWRVLTWQAK